MSMDLGVKKFSTAPQYFEAGDYPIAKAVQVAGEELEAHAPVALESGKLVKVTSSNKDKVYGLLPDSVRADEEGPVYLTGEFFADSLVLDESVTAKDLEEPLRKIGVFLKNVPAAED